MYSSNGKVHRVSLERGNVPWENEDWLGRRQKWWVGLESFIPCKQYIRYYSLLPNFSSRSFEMHHSNPNRSVRVANSDLPKATQMSFIGKWGSGLWLSISKPSSSPFSILASSGHINTKVPLLCKGGGRVEWERWWGGEKGMAKESHYVHACMHAHSPMVQAHISVAYVCILQ